jgi:hypothetical protein
MSTTKTTRYFGIGIQFPDNSITTIQILATSRRNAWSIARKEYEPQGLRVAFVEGY